MNATYAACLTPPGAGAIAVLAVRGPRACDIVRELWQGAFAPWGPGAPLPGNGLGENQRFYLGRFGAAAADEAVLSVRRWEPVPWLELHCHGGPAVVRMGLDLLAARGAVVCSWQELERHTAFRRLQAEAAIALARARTIRTAGILLDQYHGALEAALGSVLGALERQEHARAAAQLDELAARIPLGLHLTEPWRVVVAGAPNVGKSSLVNALAGYPRSVVSAVPGTTRDVVTAAIAVDGWPVELTDTAGLHAPASALEGQGIERARAAIARADLCLWVLDASAPAGWTPEPVVPADHHGPGGHSSAPATHRVLNKTDLLPAGDLAQTADSLPVSARTGAGIPELCSRLAQWLVPVPPPPGSPVPFTPSIADGIGAARRRLRANDPSAAAALLREWL